MPLLHRLTRIGTLVLAAASLLLAAPDAPCPVHAAGMVVNTLADANPPITDGLCSLREAITNANNNAATHPDCSAGAGADTITFSLSGTIRLVATMPELTDDAELIIDGAGRSITLSGDHSSRALVVATTGSARLRSLAFAAGTSLSQTSCFTLGFGQASGGGAVCNRGRLTVIDSSVSDNWSQGYRGGAIASSGELVVEGSTFARNFDDSPGGGAGGAIYSLGPLSVRDSEFMGNFVRIFGAGGAIYSESSLSIAGSKFLGNIALGAGGAITQQGANILSVTKSTFAGNSSGTGGAIDMVGVSSIDSTTFVGNSALGWGGAVSHGSLGTVNNSTISGNTAGEDGGGMAIGGPVMIVNSTITGNTSGKRGGGVISGGLTLMNTILAGNSSPEGPACAGQPVSLIGPNLLGSTSGCIPTSTPPIVGLPLLAALADNGGPTWTHALLPGSPALNAGDPAVCAASPIGGVDQRGMPRPSASCDLGAYEASPVGGRNLKVSATSGQVGLGWDTGTDQTGYTLLTYNTATAAASLTSLPAHAVAHTHTGATNGVLYCYVLAATGPSGVLGLSDLECALPGSQSGAVIAGDLTLGLHGTTNASLTWQPPIGGADSYLLVRIPLDGTPPNNTPLTGTATASTQPLPTAGACFQLVAYQGVANAATNVLSGVPGVTTLGARGQVTALADAEGLLTQRAAAFAAVAGQVVESAPSL